MTETIATYDVPQHHIQMYTSNVQAALAKEGGLLLPFVSMGSYVGERAQVVNFLGPIFFRKRDTKFADTEITEVDHKQRWITGDEYDTAIFVDRLDTLKMIYDPSNPYTERMREAAARKQDDIIMERFFSIARTGRQGTINTAFPAADTIVAGGTRMSVVKLRSVRKLMKRRHCNLRRERPLIAVTAEQIDDLLGEVAVGSNDYNAVKPLVDGEVSSFMGFTFVPYEDQDSTLPGIPRNTVNNARQCPVWVPSGMHYGDWQSLVIVVSPRPDKNNIKQIHATFTAGATRIEEGRVFMLECLE
jgi:hypothetical protein